MPTIQINLYAMLREFVDGAPSVELLIEPGDTIAEVLSKLGIPEEKARVIFVDHRAGQLTTALQGGEQIGVFPAIGGG